MKNFLKSALVVLMIFSLCGCAAVLLGAGILGGAAISDDTVQSYIDKDFDSLWNISLDVLGKMGTVEEKNKDTGVIKAVVEKSNVTIKLEGVTDKTTRLKISARKIRKLLPDIDKAAIINNRIAKQAEKGWF
ncbi:MAG: DUF3568 family protein [Candidatus Omnitrophota bacterium]